MTFNYFYNLKQLDQLHREEEMRKAENYRRAVLATAGKKSVRASVLNRMGDLFINAGEGLQRRYGTTNKAPDTVTRKMNQPA